MRLKDVAEMSLSQLSGEDNLKDLLYLDNIHYNQSSHCALKITKTLSHHIEPVFPSPANRFDLFFS